MNKALLLLLSTSVLLALTTLHLVRELRAERSQAQALQARIAELERDASLSNAFEASFAPASGAAADSPRSPFHPAAGEPAAATTAPSSAAAPFMPDQARLRASMERERALLRDPEYRDALLLQHRTILAQTHRGLADELGLTQDEADHFFALLAQQQLKMQETIVFDGDPTSPEEQHRRIEQHERSAQDEIRALLGEDKWNAWRQYQSMTGVREQAEQLRREFAVRGAPLRDDQVEPLQRALAESHQRSIQNWSSFQAQAAHSSAPAPGAGLQVREETLRLQNEENERLRTSLAGVLAPEQLKYLEERHQTQAKLQEAHMRMMRVRDSTEAQGDASLGSGSGRRALSAGAASSGELER